MDSNKLQLTEEVKKAIQELFKADSILRYPEQQPIDSPQSKKCIELGLINSAGCFIDSLPKEIEDFIEKTYM